MEELKKCINLSCFNVFYLQFSMIFSWIVCLALWEINAIVSNCFVELLINFSCNNFVLLCLRITTKRIYCILFVHLSASHLLIDFGNCDIKIQVMPHEVVNKGIRLNCCHSMSETTRFNLHHNFSVTTIGLPIEVQKMALKSLQGSINSHLSPSS